MSKQQITGFQSYLKPLIWGVLVGTFSIVILFIIASIAIAKLPVPIPSISLIVSICGGIGTFLGGYTAAKIFRKKGLIIGLICGAVFVLIILLTTMCFSGAIFSAESLTKYVILLVAAALGGTFGVNAKTRRHH